MATAEVEIYNLALSALGTSSSVASVSEVSREAEQCALWYEPVRDQIFRAAPWPRLTGFSRLALSVERDQAVDWVITDPDPKWGFAYALPSDYIRPRYLSTYVQFQESMVGDLPVLVTNAETPILTYTRKIARVDLWDPDLTMAVVFGLAAHIAKPITGKTEDLRNMFELAQEKIYTARMNARNSDNASNESIPEWLSARGYGGNAPLSKYIYPSADFTVAGYNNLG